MNKGKTMANESIGKSNKRRVVLGLGAVFLISVLTAFMGTLSKNKGIDFGADNLAEVLTELIIFAAVTFALFSSEYVYFKFLTKKRKQTDKNIFVVFSINFLAVASALVLSNFVNAALVPLSFSAITICVLVGKRESIVSTVFCTAVLTLYAGADYAVIPLMLALVESIFMILLMKGGYGRFKMVWGNTVIAAGKSVLFALMELFVKDLDGLAALYAGLWSLGGGVGAVFVAAAFIPLYENVFNIWTPFKAAEECNFNKPLLRELSEKAPGTFNHSLVVGNLAESCAQAIGEDPYLARAAGYYHDIVRMNRPEFFAENQMGYNPHDDLIPEVSVSMIKKHTSSGYEILQEHRMPEIISSVALEHHGTSPVTYFYLKAQGITEGKLDSKEYRYDGPKPTSKIAAIIMVADSVEAATRAAGTMETEKLDNFIYNIIADKISNGQFDECDITLQDLNTMRRVMVSIIPSLRHKRVKYQNEEEMKEKGQVTTK